MEVTLANRMVLLFLEWSVHTETKIKYCISSHKDIPKNTCIRYRLGWKWLKGERLSGIL
jgi:hypothetical protein